ncbi:MAG: transcriptional repressor [Campylobacteraceae bacterium]|nr:transcriptional repressor [Campylobacteraceae bacterium]
MKNVKKLLNSNNIKLTTAREAILWVLNDAKKPLNYEEIKSLLKIDMDKATFYRNISLFEDEKIVQKFESNDKKWYFEIIKKSHAHFLCDSCHNIICMNFNLNENLEEYTINSVLLKGICKDCK